MRTTLRLLSWFIIFSLPLISQTSWKGTSSTSWGTSSNWTNGVPSSFTDAIIGDANFTGSYQPSITSTSYCKSLTLGSGTKVSNLSVGKKLIVSGNVTIGSNGTITHTASYNISLKGSWSNSGTYTTTTTSATVTFAGTAQTILTGTTFQKLVINSGSVVTLASNIVVNRSLSVSGTIEPGELPTYRITGNGSHTVKSGGTVRVKGSTFSSNYGMSGSVSLESGSTVQYAATTVNQTVSKSYTYSTLRISGAMTKTLEGNLPTLKSSSSSRGNVFVDAGTLDLSSYSANRGTSTIGGTFSVASGAALKIGGTNSFPSNYAIHTIASSSSIEYSGTNQSVSLETYGNLTFSASSGSVSKTLPSSPFTIAGNLTSTVGNGTSVSFTANNTVTVNQNVTIGASTYFNAGSFNHSFGGNLTVDGTFSGNTSTITMTGGNSNISGNGALNFYNLAIQGSNCSISPTTNLSVLGSLSTSGAGTLTHTSGGTGTLTMNGSSKTISGDNISLNNLTISGSISTASSMHIAGNFSVTNSLSVSGGTITMNGIGKSISGSGSIIFNALHVSGSITTGSSFTLLSNLSVEGSFTATAGTMTFGGATVFSGTANLFNTTLNGVILQMASGSHLGLAGTTTLVAGTFDVTSSTPSTIDYNSTSAQTVYPIMYDNLMISNPGIKSSAGAITVNRNFTINAGATFNASSHTHTVFGNWVNNGTFNAGTSTIQLPGSIDASLGGQTTFNTLTINKSTSANVISLLDNMTASTLNMMQGELHTDNKAVTITSTRTGEGVIHGTITRTHSFSTGTSYAFESPYNTINFSSVSGVSSVTMTVAPNPVTDFPYGASINREYSITIPSGSYIATLRLHYRDAELKGNLESTIKLWNYTSTWTDIGKTGYDATNNWVEKSGLNSLSGRWTLSDDINAALWVGTVSSAWEDENNWLAIQGSPSLPPSTSDLAQLGAFAALNNPVISSTVIVKDIRFESVQASTLTFGVGGSLSAGNITGLWNANATHTINVGSQSLTLSGDLVLSDGTNGHAINLTLGTGTVNVGGAVTQSGGANVTFTGSGNLQVGGNFNYADGTFNAGSGTVMYNGHATQIVAGGISYNNLTFAKTSGTATLSSHATVSGSLTLLTGGTILLEAPLSITGNVTINSGTLLNGGSSAISVGGNWFNNGSFSENNSTVLFNGSGTQTASPTTFNHLTINKSSGTFTPTGNLTIQGNFTIQSGTADLTTFTANRSSSGGTFTLAGTSSLKIAGANNFPSNYSSYTIASTSTVEYNGTSAQSISPVTYGNLTISNGGSNEKTLTGNVSVGGDLLINSGATMNGNSSTLQIAGNWTNNGTFTPSLSTIVLTGTSKSLIGQTTFNGLTVAGNYTSLNNIVVNGPFTLSGTYNAGTTSATASGNVLVTGTFITNGTTTFTGTVPQTIEFRGTISGGATSVVVFAGSVPPVLNSTSSPTFVTVMITNTGGITASTNWTVYGAFIVGAGAAFHGGSSTHTFYNTFTNNGSITSSGTLLFAPSSAKTLTLNGTAFTNTGLVRFGGTGQITLAGNAPSFNTVEITNSHAAGITPVSNWLLTDDFSVEQGASFHSGSGLSHIVSGTFTNNGTFDGGTSSFTMNNQTAADISGSGTTVFNNLTIGGVITALGDFDVTGNFINNGTFDPTGVAITFSGSSNSTIGGSVVPVPFDQLEIAKTSATTFLTANITGLTSLLVSSGTLDASSYTMTQDAVGGTLTLSEGGTLKIGGSNTMPTFNGYLIDEGSTVEYSGVGSQTIVIQNYGNLTSSSTGARVLPSSGIIGVAGTFSPGTNSYTITGSTINFIGSGSQTIPAFTYHNLTSSSTGARSFASSGTIGITGTFLPGTNSYSNTGSTIEFKGTSEQIIPAFNYYHLASSSTGTRTLSSSGTIGIAGTFLPGINSYTTTGSTIAYNGTDAQSIPSFGYVHLTINGSGTKTATGDFIVPGNLTLNNNLLMNENTLTMGTSSTTLGAGDVVGKVRRTSLSVNTPYTFGNQFTTMTFLPGGTMPTEMSINISLGESPSWKSDAIQRYYDIIQTGGTGVRTSLQLHYNNVELNGNSENTLDLWHKHFGIGDLEEHGLSAFDTLQKWVKIDNISIEVFAPSYGQFQWTLSNQVATNSVWDGDFNTSWTNAANWIGNIPGSDDEVVIPELEDGHYAPTLPSNSTIKSLTIESGGVLNGGNGTTLTVNGSWQVDGEFNPGTSTVIFDSNSTLGGTTTFHNVTINTSGTASMLAGAKIIVHGTIINNGTFDARTNSGSVVEFSGGNQTIINPNGGAGGYRGLVLYNTSGSAVKSLPLTSLSVEDSLILISGGTSLSVNSGNALDINGKVSIGVNTTLNDGGFSVNVGGDWNNSGTFTATGTLTFDGTTPSSVNSSSVRNFVVDKTASTVSLAGNVLVNGNLSVSGGTFDLATFTADRTASGGTLTLNDGTTLKIGGTNSLPSNYSTHWVGSSSAVEYSGATQSIATLNSGQNYGNLYMSGSGTKLLGGNIIVAGDASVTNCAFELGTNTLNRASSGGTFSLGNGSTLRVAGTSGGLTGSNFPANFALMTLNGIVMFNGAGSQTIPALQYTHLRSDSTGARTLASTGTIAISETFTPGTNSYTTTNSTVEFNGSNEQTIPSFNYYNLTSSGTGARILSSTGVIGIAGTFTSGINSYTTTESTVEYNGSTAQTVSTFTYNNLTIAGNNTKTAGGNITVNALLSLQNDLTLSANTLLLDASATTQGNSDVLGSVRRTTFASNVTYSFGQQHTVLRFSNGGTLPSEVTVTTEIGSAPPEKTDAILRTYNITQTGGSGYSAILRLQYKESELNGNSEDLLTFWDLDGTFYDDHGKTNYSTTENWVQNSGMSEIDELWTLANRSAGERTWIGTVSSDWNDPGNWVGGIPTSNDVVRIPDATTTNNDPVLPALTTIGQLQIDSGALLNGGAGTELTVRGAWINFGTFTAGTSTVIFDSLATHGGLTSFYNITVAATGSLTMLPEAIMRIAGTFTNNGIFDAISNEENTVEYNGGDQTIVNPNGGGGGYEILALSSTSGSATKSLPASALEVHDTIRISSTGISLLVIANGSLTIGESFEIGANCTFDDGGFNHLIEENWTNNGTFTTSGTMTFGSSFPSVIGASNFNNLIINKTLATATLNGNISVAGNLQINGGTFDLSTFTANRASSGGTLTLGNGTTMRVGGTNSLPSNYTTHTIGETSTIEFSGTNQIIPLLNSGQNFGNLVIKNSGVTTLSGSIGITGDVIITGGTFDLDTFAVNRTSSGGTFTLSNGSSLVVGGSGGGLSGSNFPANFSSYILNGTVEFDGTKVQTIPALNYFHLQSSSTGSRVLSSSGTIGVTGTFSAGTNAYTTTGSTMEFNNSGAQIIPAFSYFNLTNSSTGPRTLSSSGFIEIAGTFTPGTNPYTVAGSSVKMNGTGAQTLPSFTFDTLRISGTGVKDATGTLTVNGSLTLDNNLQMNVHTLTMGATATTLGDGDVIGIVRRTTLLPSTSYSFGNRHTTMTFAPSGILPSEMSVKISIGSSPSWKTDAIQRSYDIIQTGANENTATLRLHYHESELNGNSEANLDFWHKHFNNADLEEHGRTSINTTENWIEMENINLSSVGTSFGQYQWSLSNQITTSIVWDGDFSTSWNDPANWIGGVPGPNSDVVFPTPYSEHFLASLPANTTVRSITIQFGGALNGNIGTLHVKSSWSNQGTFTAGTSTVQFDSVGIISGITNFHNVVVGSSANITMAEHAVMRIAGTLTNDGTYDASTNDENVIEYNGGDQTVINPNGGVGGYESLILSNISGTATKTLPASSLSVIDTFMMKTTGTSLVVEANNSISVGVDFLLGANCSFDDGGFTHAVAGNWTNNGTYLASGTITLNGTSSTISASNFNNLVVNKTGATATLYGNISLAGDLNISEGTFDLSSFTADRATPGGTLTLANGTTLNIGGTNSLPGNYQTHSIGSTSTIEYSGTTQTIATPNSSQNYGNLIVSGSEIKSLAGNIGIEGNLTVEQGVLDLNTYTANRISAGGTLTLAENASLIVGGTSGGLAGSNFPSNFGSIVLNGTVEFDGSGDQTIPVLNYYNLNSSSTGKRILSSSGNTGIAGTFLPGTNAYVTTGCVLDFNGTNQPIPSFEYETLLLSNSGTKTLSGSSSVNNTFSLLGGILNDNGFTLSVLGDLVNNTSHTGSGKIELTGNSSPRTLSGSGSFGNLELNDANGVQLTSNLSMNGLLTFSLGNIYADTHTVVINPTGSIQRTSGHVVGKLQQYIARGTPSLESPVGDSMNYTPVELTILNVSTPGSLTISTTPTDHPLIASSNIGPTRSVNRHWTISNVGAEFDTYDAVFNFAPSDIDTGVTFNDFIVEKYHGGWTELTEGTRTPTSIQVLTTSTFSDFQIGGTNANPEPTLTKILPTSEVAGADSFTMSVYGTNFFTGSVVRFNGVDKNTTFISSTELSAVITPSDLDTAGTFNVVVNNPAPGGGESNGQTFQINNPAPILDLISPTKKTVGDTTFTLTVTGVNFVPHSVIYLNNTAKSTTFVSSSQLSAAIPTSDLITAGEVKFTVFNPEPGGGTSNPQFFTIENPAPSVDSISPSTTYVGSPLFTLSVFGKNFVSGSSAKVNASNRSTTFVNPTQLNVTIPTSDLYFTGILRITIYNSFPGGGTSNAETLLVINPPPTTTGISPSSKIVGSPSFTLTVNGSAFLPSSVVRVNGSERTSTFISPYQMRALVLASDIATTGTDTITVVTPSPGGGISNEQLLTVVDNLISGMKFHDLNMNGINDAGEPGVEGWRIRLIKNGTQIESTLTDASGNYYFSRLLAGTYTVREKSQSDWVRTLPSSGNSYDNIVLADGASVTGLDFGNYKLNTISGMIYYDQNANGAYDSGERGLTGVTVNAIASNPVNNTSTSSLPGGIFTLSLLPPETYIVSVTLTSHQEQTYPPSGTYLVSLVNNTDTTGFNFGVTLLPDSTKYRTFSSFDYSTKSAIKRKAVATAWSFRFTNLTGRIVNKLHVEFTGTITSFDSLTPFTDTNLVGKRMFDFVGTTISDSQTISLSGTGPKNGLKVGRWWWAIHDSIIGGKQKAMKPFTNTKLLAMPNAANVREETFAHGYPLGMTTGISRTDSTRRYGWVTIFKGADMQKSLLDKTGYHTGQPKGFATFSNNGRFVGLQKSLPPSKQNNKLFAEIITLKCNITASALGITPAGLGELIYEEGTNPLSGLMLKEIATRADTLMTYWYNVPLSTYTNLDTTIRKINLSFQGTIDTISFGAELLLKGVRSLDSVTFLLPNPSALIERIARVQQSTNEGEMPEEFALYQNYPNPFNPVTTLSFVIGHSSLVTLKVYNMLGQEIATIIDKNEMEEGEYEFPFNASSFASGVYFYHLHVESENEDGNKQLFTDVKRMMVLK